jgi:AcrR family transcriptional regulator
MYTPYKGVGALDPARNETVSEARSRNAVAGDNWVVATGARKVATDGKLMNPPPDRPVCIGLNHTDLSGTVNPMNTKTGSAPRLSARQRLLAAAGELFYENGINTVGIDRIIEHAGVAKASLYDCFGSKEELIRAYLQERGEIRRARVNERLARFEDPADQILAVFDLLAELASQPDYRGCAFMRASADASASEKVRGVVNESRAFMLEKFTDLCRSAGAADPQLLAKQLVLLYDGATVSAYMDGSRNAIASARALAAQMLVLHNLTAKKY